MDSWVADIPFERMGLLRKLAKTALFNPLANYAPASLLRGLLRLTKSELAAANWADPGGWRSMVISYDGHPRQWADKILVGAGTMSMALRNRRRLAARVIARLINDAPHVPVHVLCLGAGPGQIILDAMLEARCEAHATLVDLNSDAFEYGQAMADSCGLSERMRYVQGDVRDVARTLDHRVDVVKMMGICEYLSDEHLVEMARCVTSTMPRGGAMVCNSLSDRHGNDRFFRRVFGLHMIHRTVHQLEAMLTQAGFGDFVSLPEPLGVYHVLVARRQ